MKKILVTGGAGYIGAHVSELLMKSGYSVTILDNFSSGLESRVRGIFNDICKVDLLNREILDSHLKGIDFVVHLAAKKSVDESMRNPLKYYSNNVAGTINLLAAMSHNKVKGILFSSSAAVYSPTDKALIEESDATFPVSVYGATKLLGEQIVSTVAQSEGMSSISLRYFNVVGASRREFRDNSESNLFPRVISAINSGISPEIYGSDYATRDGTCVRDFIHVSDLAEAHLRALELLQTGNIHEVYNVGTGIGYTVKEVVEALCNFVKADPAVTYKPKRIGDSPNAVAANTKIKRDLSWSALRGLEEMVRSMWDLESK